jgi:hypothetical protein
MPIASGSAARADLSAFRRFMSYIAAMEPARIRIASARDNAEAALIRSILGAHGIKAVVSGEQHASMLGGLAGPMISLDVWVDREDGAHAAELIEQLRSGTPAPDDDEDDEDDDEPTPVTELDPHDADLGREDPDDRDRPIQHWGIESRRRTGVVLLLACCVTFGTAHLYTRAWMRGFALAAIEIVGLRQIGAHTGIGAAMVAGAVAADLIGAMIRVRRQVRDARLPTAHLRR